MDIKMKATSVFDAEGLVAVGTLEKLQSLRTKLNQAAGLPGDIPVLTCPVAATDAHCLASNYGQSSFGFGRMQLEDGMLMTIRLQLGDLQIYWLAEMTDPEVWAAIDMWRRARRVPIGFKVDAGDQRRVKFCAPEVPLGKLDNEQFRTPDREPTAHTWHGIASLAGSGVLQTGATSDIPTVPLRRVFVNAVLTERLQPFTNDRPIVKQRLIVKLAQR